jgi:alpha-L-fucosidase
MRKRNNFWIFVLCLTALPLLCQAQRKEEDDNRVGFNLNKPEREEWLRDLGFGIQKRLTSIS